MMTKQQIEEYLFNKVEEQVLKVQTALNNVVISLSNHDWKTASEGHRQVDYWLSRVKNTQRLIDELEDLE